MQTMSVSEAKDKLSQLVEAVESTHDAVVITRHGRAAVAMISIDDLDSLQETLALLADPDHAKEVAEADAAIAAGNTSTIGEVRRELGLT